MAVGSQIGWQYIKSTSFEMRRLDDGYRFEGRGSGHGVGMCVIGSTRLAARGQTAREILTRYFPGTTIESMREGHGPVVGHLYARAGAGGTAGTAGVAGPARSRQRTPRQRSLSMSMPAPAGISKRSCREAGSSWRPRSTRRAAGGDAAHP